MQIRIGPLVISACIQPGRQPWIIDPIWIGSKNCSSDEPHEHGLGIQGAACQFRMELGPDEIRVYLPWELQNLHDRLVRVSSGEDEPSRLKLFDHVGFDFISMTESLPGMIRSAIEEVGQ